MIDLEKREEVIALYDIYNELLTDKQKMYFEEYYYCDMTLQEIASLHNISRNAVFDQLKRQLAYVKNMKIHYIIWKIKNF